MNVKSPVLGPATSTSPAAIDAEHPWLGLASYTEETREYFHGRDDDAAELARRVQRKLLTVLFGQSGHGKTSLLRAGLVPRLRPEGFCPVYVRLDYDPNSPAPSEQIKREVFRATLAAGTWTQSGSAVEGESLWEFLHHRDDVLRDAAGRTLIPILIFDQFEEIFTLAQTDDAGRRRAQAFLRDLADLVENRPPAELEARIDRDEVDAAKFDFARADYRILIALREDYLAHLEGLKASMPSVTQNRVRLARFTGPQALTAVRQTAPHLVSEEVAAQVVRFVGGGTDLAQAEVEPSLLSLVCRELNNTRLARGQAAITSDLLAGSRETILQEFYERALADQPAGVRRFIEDELLTESGYRESVAEERVKKAFAAGGAAPDALAQLVGRRLLRVEERLDVRRVELTHDVLCGVVAVSRGVRHEREARDEAQRQLAEQKEREAATRRALVRARAVAAVCAVLMLVAAGSAVFGWINLRRARAAEAQAQATRQLAESARGEAEKLVGFLLEDFYEELEPTGRLETVGRLAQQAVNYYDGLPADLQTPQTRRYRGMALVREGAALFSHGDANAAAPVLKEAKGIFEKLQAEGDRGEETSIGLALSVFGGVAPGLGLTARAPEMKRMAELLRPFVYSPNPSRRVRRVYADMLNYICHTQTNEAAIATCEEARKILVGMGATDASDLGAASAYGDIGDSEARHALALGRLDDAEKLELEVDQLAEKVLAKRPGDLRAMEDRWYAPNVLADVAFRRFDYARALKYSVESQVAAENYVRFNPASALGWDLLGQSRLQLGEANVSLGQFAEAIRNFRDNAAIDRDPRNTTGVTGDQVVGWLNLSWLEAQLGHREEAEAALTEGRRISTAVLAKTRADPGTIQTAEENLNGMAGVLLLAGGDAAAAYAKSTSALQRLEAVKSSGSAQFTASSLRRLRWVVAEAGLRAGHASEAEAAVRVLLAAPGDSIVDPPSEEAVARSKVLLAQLLAVQGRKEEARKTLAPALDYFRQQRAHGASHNEVVYPLARAFYVQSLIEDDSPAGRAARRSDLDEAAAALAAFPGDTPQLHDSQELAGWIAAARAALVD